MTNKVRGGLHYTDGEKPELQEGMSQGDVFFRTNIFIETESFKGHEDGYPEFMREGDLDEFNRNVRNIFSSLNIAHLNKDRLDIVTPDGRDIHVHPDCLSGYLTEKEATQIMLYFNTEGMNKTNLTLRYIDLNSPSEFISIQEREKRIDLMQKEIDNAILGYFKTKKQTIYIDSSRIDMNKAGGLISSSVPSLKIDIDTFHFNKHFFKNYAINDHIESLNTAFKLRLQALMKDGRLTAHPIHQNAYRSLNKAEMSAWQKQQKAKPPVMKL